MTASNDISSVAWPGDKKVLTVGEVAGRWRISRPHVIGLIEEGKLAAFDIAGRHEYVRAPMNAIKEIARLMNVKPEAVLAIISAAKPMLASRRAYWRVPVVEGYNAFMRENHSLNLK